jgi:release factor glutamine methyltransferase
VIPAAPRPSPPPNPLFARIQDAARALQTIGAGNPRLEAEYLMAHALGVGRIRLWLIEDPPPMEALARFEALLTRRLGREPLQYVLGTAEFAGLTLEVGPGVFIPRSETEVLVEAVAGRLTGPARIADVGTGSGAILLALLARLPAASGIGVDGSEEALQYARRNARRCRLDARAEWLRGDLLEPVPPGAALDAVVSNPPYIRLDESDALAPEIRDHEPHAALFAGEDGLDEVRRLIPAAASRLRSGGLLAMEIGITQGESARRLLGDGSWQGVEVLPDLTGRPRVALAIRTED